MKYIIVVLVLLFSHSVKAIDTNNLAKSSAWEKLLHFKNNEPTITSSEFYLSDPFSLSAELKATISALKQVQISNVKHAQCRFPARKLWIESRFPEINFPKVACPEYDKWLEQTNAKSISLVFASSFLDNPASMYGHVLLKFNRKDGVNDLLHTSLNYGALTPPNENMVVYVVKGIFGGYEGYFSNAGFYKNSQLYGDLELRDLSEYQLNLTSWQTALIVAHTYEMLQAKMTYFFFKENCALQLADILTVVLEKPIYSDWKPFLAPLELIYELQEQGLISNFKGYPSLQTQFHHKWEKLSDKEKDALENWLESNSASQLEKLSIDRQFMVLDAALAFSEFAFIKHKDNNLYASQKYPSLLRLSSLKDHGQRANASLSNVVESTKLSKISTGVWHENSKNGLQLSIRAANNDSLNRNIGRPKFSSMSMFDLNLRLHDQVKVHQLDLVKVESIQPSISGLKYDESSNFQFRIAYKGSSQPDKGWELLAGKGWSYRFSEDMVVAGFVNASVNSGDEKVSVIPQVKVIRNNNQFAYELDFQYNWNPARLHRREVIGAKFSYNLSKTFDIRLNAKRDYRNSIGIELGHYF